jgi:hypothetical protein
LRGRKDEFLSWGGGKQHSILLSYFAPLSLSLSLSFSDFPPPFPRTICRPARRCAIGGDGSWWRGIAGARGWMTFYLSLAAAAVSFSLFLLLPEPPARTRPDNNDDSPRAAGRSGAAAGCMLWSTGCTKDAKTTWDQIPEPSSPRRSDFLFPAIFRTASRLQNHRFWSTEGVTVRKAARVIAGLFLVIFSIFSYLQRVLLFSAPRERPPLPLLSRTLRSPGPCASSTSNRPRACPKPRHPNTRLTSSQTQAPPRSEHADHQTTPQTPSERFFPDFSRAF